jgi:hypothetical protein
MKNGKIMQKRIAKKSDLAWNYKVVSYYNEKSIMTLEKEKKTYLNRDIRMIMALGS